MWCKKWSNWTSRVEQTNPTPLPWAAVRPVISLGHQVGWRVFWEGPIFFILCPTHFSREAKFFLERAPPPLRPSWLRAWQKWQRALLWLQKLPDLQSHFRRVHFWSSARVRCVSKCAPARHKVFKYVSLWRNTIADRVKEHILVWMCSNVCTMFAGFCGHADKNHSYMP